MVSRQGQIPKGTTVKELYNAQVLYNSAIHPDTHEIMHPVGRMSAQLPCGMVITGILLALYKYNTVIIILYTNSINEVLPMYHAS